MKKLFFILCGALLLEAEDIYLNHVNKLINYNFKLDNKKLEYIFKNDSAKNKNHNKKSKEAEKKIFINIEYIFDNQAYITLKHFINNKLVKTDKKYIKKGDIVAGCKVQNILFDKIIFKCPNQLLVKSVNKNLFKILIK